MRCPQCQHANRPGAKFCEECGAPLARVCANCGAPLSPTAKFCPECAHPAGQVAPAQPRRFSAPGSYTPQHLVERILSSRAALEGERKQVTVLFADLKGSMELLADRDPEEARKLLDPVLERMMEAVHRYEGTVNQVMGDGIMALFGAPLACEDHAVRACYAALRMQETVKRYAEGVRRTEGIPIQIRLGLNSGEVVVRSIGSDLHMDYTAVGQTTHIAARMEQLALPGSILLSAETLALAEGYVEVKPLGPLPVKGLEARLEVYELTRAATVRSRFQAAAARGLTRFVGRESELEQLRQALERARAGHGQVVAVVGEPGVGKSRLYWEFTHSHRAQGWLVLESGSVSYGKATNYLPMLELLRAYFQIEPADEPRKIREKVTGKLLSLDRQLEPCISPILWLLDVPVEDEAWERLDPPQRRQRILDAVKRLLLRESQVQPLMALFEDLHWIDAETQALLDSLVESLPTARLLLLVNYRPEYTHGWGSKTYYRQLQIDPLPPESAEALLDALLGSDASLAPLKQLVIERTEGNPFFIEETVRALVETGVLAGERGAYRLTRVVHGLQVPATAQAMLAARIDRLAPEDKRLLQAAAVIGTDVPFSLLQAVADEPEERLRQGLGQLQATEFLHETRLFPDLEYTFRHALTHEVAYGSPLADRRRALHARIVEAIESLYPDRLVEHVERLAHHALRGEVWAKAVTYLRQAGAKAAGRSAYREAVSCFEQALGALKHLPETRETKEQAIDLRLALRSSLWPSGDLGRILAYLREAESLAAALDDPRRLTQVLQFLSEHFRPMGAYDQASTAARRALALATASGEVALQAQANQRLGAAYLAQGDYRRAIDCLRHSVAGFDTVQPREYFGQVILPTVLSRVYLVWCHADLGTFAEGRVLGEEGCRIAEALDHPASLMYASWGIGLLFLRKGELPGSLPLLERAVGICREIDLPIYFPRMAAALGAAYTLAGRIADAVPLLTQAMEQTTAPEMAGFRALCSLALGEAYLQAGRLDAAHALAEGALALTRRHEERGNEAYARHLLGAITAQPEPPDSETAEAHYWEARALADELGLRPLQAHCHLGLGKLYWRTGNRQEAQEQLITAMTMYREMDMRFWLEKAEAELGGIR
jgi:class 3 adenylate cyclase/tetratricopeptide (TPR) repeat protein